MKWTAIAKTMAMIVALAVAAPMLVACNTTAGAGQDVSATGQAITRGANQVKTGL